MAKILFAETWNRLRLDSRPRQEDYWQVRPGINNVWFLQPPHGYDAANSLWICGEPGFYRVTLHCNFIVTEDSPQKHFANGAVGALLSRHQGQQLMIPFDRVTTTIAQSALDPNLYTDIQATSVRNGSMVFYMNLYDSLWFHVNVESHYGGTGSPSPPNGTWIDAQFTQFVVETF
jgi:hypothetical protein